MGPRIVASASFMANGPGMDVVGHRPHAVSAIEAAANQKSIEHARFMLHESFAGSVALRVLGGTASWRCWCRRD